MRQDLKGLGTYGTVGIEFVLSILFGLFGGQWLDRKLGSAPWLTLIGTGFGIAAGVRALLRAARDAQRELADEERREREARKKYFDRSPSDPKGQ
jgi:ATP synthase protein I